MFEGRLIIILVMLWLLLGVAAYVVIGWAGVLACLIGTMVGLLLPV